MLKSIHNTVIVFIAIGFTIFILSGCDRTNAFYASSTDSLISTAQCSTQSPIEYTIDESTLLSDNHVDNSNFGFNYSFTTPEATATALSELATAEAALRELLEAHPEYTAGYDEYRSVIEAALSELKLLYTDPVTGNIGREWRFVSMFKEAEMIQAFVNARTE